MSLISIPFTFSAGAVIIASQHNSNFSTIATDYNGFIDNTNIATNAGISYSKLTLTGSIVNADINSSAAIVGSKLDLSTPGNIGATSPGTGAFTTLKVGTTHQGDVLYDNGTTLVRLTPGTSGQFLQTQGAAANPQWASGFNSNTLFEYQGAIDGAVGASGQGEVVNSTLTPATTATTTFRYLVSNANNSLIQIWSTKWIKISGVNTVTVYARLWLGTATSSPDQQLKVSIGGQIATINGTAGSTTPTWYTSTVDVSGLSNGTAYDVLVTLGGGASIAGERCCANIMTFGS